MGANQRTGCSRIIVNTVLASITVRLLLLIILLRYLIANQEKENANSVPEEFGEASLALQPFAGIELREIEGFSCCEKSTMVVFRIGEKSQHEVERGCVIATVEVERLGHVNGE